MCISIRSFNVSWLSVTLKTGISELKISEFYSMGGDFVCTCFVVVIIIIIGDVMSPISLTVIRLKHLLW